MPVHVVKHSVKQITLKPRSYSCVVSFDYVAVVDVPMANAKKYIDLFK